MVIHRQQKKSSRRTLALVITVIMALTGMALSLGGLSGCGNSSDFGHLVFSIEQVNNLGTPEEEISGPLEFHFIVRQQGGEHSTNSFSKSGVAAELAIANARFNAEEELMLVQGYRVDCDFRIAGRHGDRIDTPGFLEGHKEGRAKPGQILGETTYTHVGPDGSVEMIRCRLVLEDVVTAAELPQLKKTFPDNETTLGITTMPALRPGDIIQIEEKLDAQFEPDLDALDPAVAYDLENLEHQVKSGETTLTTPPATGTFQTGAEDTTLVPSLDGLDPEVARDLQRLEEAQQTGRLPQATDPVMMPLDSSPATTTTADPDSATGGAGTSSTDSILTPVEP